MPTSERRKFLFTLLGIVIFYAFVEAASGIFFYLHTKVPISFSKFQEKRAALHAKSSLEKLSSPEESLLTLHPYLGYDYNPRYPESKRGYPISEYGFRESKLPIQQKAPNQIIVGVLGGSFAGELLLTSSHILEEELRKLPNFKTKKIVILQLAIEGYKQPQQLLTISYLLSLGAEFDVIINIDGFNEVALPPIDNLPKQVSPFYPRGWFVMTQNVSDKNMLLAIADIAGLEDRRKDWADLFSHFPLRGSITANVVWNLLDESYDQSIQSKHVALIQYTTGDTRVNSHSVKGPPGNFNDRRSLFKELASVWMKGSVQLERICAANGIRYFHFLQPNQYFPESKPMNDQELEVAFLENHIYKAGVEEGYPQLRSSGDLLAKEGVNYTDLTMIFKNHPEPLYSDRCCHLNPQGYAIVARTVGNKVVQSLKTSRSF
jgi:hypothetical protein